MSSFDHHSPLPDPVTQAAFYEGIPTKRAVAWVIDTVVAAVLSALVLPFTAFTGIFFFPGLMLVVGFIYRWFSIAGASSTWGMRLVGIEFRDREGRTFDSAMALIHTAAFTISCAVAPLQLVSMILMVISQRKQGLTDHILGSVAINKPL